MPKTDGKSQSVERASRYLEAARISQENLWKRRQIEWKIAFSLWTAIGALTIFIYSVPAGKVPWWGIILFLVAYCFFTVMHRVLLRALFISSEKDLQFLNYYSSLAAWELDRDNFDEMPRRPKWSLEKTGKQDDARFYSDNRKKLRKHYLIIYVTAGMSFLSLVLIALRLFFIVS